MGERAVKVCLIAPVPPPYGGIGHWAQMMLAYGRRMKEVDLSIVDIAPRWRAVHDLQKVKRVVGGGIQLFRDIARVTSVLIFRRPDVLHLASSGQLAVVRDIVVMALAKLSRAGVVYHLHFGRVPVIAGAHRWEWAALRLAMRGASCVVAIDGHTYQAIRLRAPEVMVQSIPNCIDPAEVSEAVSVPHGARTVIYVGWVIPAKGVSELVDAWNRVRLLGWRLRIVGPVDAAYLRELEADKAEDIEFTGELAHAAAMQAMAEADVLVLPSHTEGFPYVVLEAMMLGKAVIATPVGAIPEMLAGGSGVLVGVRDAQDLGRALRRVMEDANLRSALGACAKRKAAAEYCIDAVFAQHLAVWRAVSGRAG